jgi:nucleotide-binding universal stress UspA family protein
MIRTIMVPLDGSEFAERALPIATELARWVGASLRLVTVHDIGHTPLPVSAETLTIAEIERQTQEQASQYLRRMADEASAGGVPVTHALRIGYPATALIEDADDENVDLIVMTTHGRGGISRLWLGSVADRLSRQADCPVLLLRPDAMPPSITALFENVLVPLDGTARAESVLGDVEPLVAKADGTLHLLTVVVQPFLFDPPPRPSFGALHAASVEQQMLYAYRYLRRLARPHREAGRSVVAEAVTSTDPAAEIMAYARQHGARLVAIATHGRGGLARWAIGSVADKIIRSGSVAVLVHHTDSVRDRNELSEEYEAAVEETDPIDTRTPELHPAR